MIRQSFVRLFGVGTGLHEQEFSQGLLEHMLKRKRLPVGHSCFCKTEIVFLMDFEITGGRMAEKEALKRIGRPPGKVFTHGVCVRVTEEMMKNLNCFAKEGPTISELIRSWIDRGLKESERSTPVR